MSRRKIFYAAFFIVGCLFGGLVISRKTVVAEESDASTSETQLERLFGKKILIPFPETSGVEFVPENANGTNTASTGTAHGHEIHGQKTLFYKTLTWGEIESDFSEFQTKVRETLEDERGWIRAGVQFVENENNPDFLIILSDTKHLDTTSGCSGDLSCTTWNNEVIINDLRWREGTEASRNAGMETRDYQHMVVNHEVGHWLGHYAHETSCPNGGPAPIMLQQSTGLRGCDSFNVWPLENELWILR